MGCEMLYCSSCVSRQTRAVQILPFSGFQDLVQRHFVGLFGRRIGASQNLRLHRTRQIQKRNFFLWALMVTEGETELNFDVTS
jgi:hypothetical protein